MPSLSSVLVASLLLLLASSCQAGNVGRQRRVHTSATSTGATQLSGFGLPPLWHATYASNDEYIETPVKRFEVIAPRSQAAQEAQQAQGALEWDLLDVTPAQLQQLLLGAAAAAAPAPAPSAATPIAGQQRFFGGDHQQAAGEGRFWAPKTYVFVVSSGNNSAPPAGADNITITNILTNVQNNSDSSTTATTTPATTTRLVAADALRTPGLMPLQYFQTRQGQDVGANYGGLHLPYNLLDYNQAGLGGAVPLVPVTLGNNAVGYVPLNLRMFRQLIDAPAPVSVPFPAVPIRESEDDIDAVTPNPVEAMLEPELESQPEINEDVAPAAAQKTAGSRFQFFGQRLRRPVVANAPTTSEYAIKSPFLSFKNLRRVQYV